MSETISILTNDHVAYKYWAGYIMKNFNEFSLLPYSGAEKKEFLDGFSRYPSDIAILFKIAKSENDNDVQDIIKTLKKISKNTKVIAIDIIAFFSAYAESGADFLLQVGKVTDEELDVIKRLVRNETLREDDKNIVYEKKDFYDYVGEGDIFTRRARKTAYKGAELNSIAINLVINQCNKILDAGCGNGRLSIPLAKLGFDVTGIDVSERLIKKARRKSTVPKFIVGDLLHPPFVHGTQFDAVLMMWHVICEFRSRRNEVLRNVSLLLRHKGLLIFDFPDTAKNVEISKTGAYSSRVNNGFKKYLGLVPDVKDIVETLEHLGFDYVGYKRLKWGIHKFCVIARKN